MFCEGVKVLPDGFEQEIFKFGPILRHFVEGEATYYDSVWFCSQPRTSGEAEGLKDVDGQSG
jgi:hypothetical protein